MLAYDEMVQSFDALLECKTLSEFERLQERTLADGVVYAVFGPQYRGTRVLHESTILKRKQEALQECLKEMCHDGVNIFRVMVFTQDDNQERQFPVAFQTIYESEAGRGWKEGERGGETNVEARGILWVRVLEPLVVSSLVEIA